MTAFDKKEQKPMPPSFFQCITDFIFVEDKLQPADILFLPGGSYPEAAREAASLYLEEYAPLILPSGRYSILQGSFPGNFATEWEYLTDILLSRGVPKEAILREDTATFTYENAVKSREAVESLGLTVTRAILVCQSFHARRCLMYYQEQFPETRILVHPVVTRGITRDNWYLDGTKIDVVLGEVERCGSQFHEIMRMHLKSNGEGA